MLVIIIAIAIIVTAVGVLYRWYQSNQRWQAYTLYTAVLLSLIKSHLQSRGDFTRTVTEYVALKDRLQEKDEHLKNIGQVIGGVILLFGVWVTYEQLKSSQQQFEQTLKGTRDQIELSRKSQTLDSFKEAIHYLGAEDVITRNSGLLVLERISQDSRDEYYSTVNGIIVSFIRDQATEKNYKKLSSSGDGWPRVDLQTALSIVGRRIPKNGESKPDLKGIFLSNANLSGLKLDGVNLDKAVMKGVILEGGSLKDSSLREADMELARLSNCDLSEIDLYKANLHKAVLKYAIFTNAKLEESVLTEAQLSLAKMNRAILTKADFSRARMLETIITDADLEGAIFTDVELLTQFQINSAKGDTNTRLPSSLVVPRAWHR